MPLINEIIPPRTYELIRDSLCTLLADELNNQFALTADPLYSVKIYKEFGGELSAIESILPAILVSVSDVDTLKNDTDVTHCAAKFNIDVFTRAKTTATARGDERAATDCERLAGAVWAILQNPYYYYTGLEASGSGLDVISTRKVQGVSFSKADPREQLAIDIAGATIRYSVEYYQSNGVASPETYSGSDYETDSKLIIN